MKQFKKAIKEYFYFKRITELDNVYLWFDHESKKFIVTIAFTKEFWSQNNQNNYELIK